IAGLANQFSFALVAGITHGAATPSNFAIDGKWLDLTTASFVDGGKNYKISSDQSPFFDEHKVAVDIIFDLTRTYSKYNNISLNEGVLLFYFDEVMDYYFHSYCSYLFGVSREFWTSLFDREFCESLCRYIKKVVFWHTYVIIV